MGSPMMRVFNRSLMSTVSNGILPAAATAAWRMLPQSCNWVCRRAISPSFAGSPVRIFNRAPMSTVSGQIPPAAAPWLMLPPTYEYGSNMFNRLFKVYGKMNYNFYSPADDKVISVRKRSSKGEEKLRVRSEKKAMLVGSSHGWLALHKTRFNWDPFLYNPLSHRHIKLPSVKTIPLPEWKLRNHGWGMPEKVILSCSPDDDPDSCRAIMSFGPRNNMAVCHPGRSYVWTQFGAQFHENDEITKRFQKARVVRSYEDFVYSTTLKQLFCLTDSTDIESWNLKDPLGPELNWKWAESELKYHEKTYPLRYVVQKAPREWCDVYQYLAFAEHSNKLFLVRRHVMRHMAPDGSCVRPEICDGLHERNFLEDTCPYKTMAFDIHEIDREKGELVLMNRTLDGMSFFIGSKGDSFVVESPEKMNLKPNSIYFTDPDQKTPVYWTYGGHDIGIFDYKNWTISPCYYPCDINKVKRIEPAPLWFTPSPSPAPV